MRFAEEGVEEALNEKPRPVRPPKLTGRDEAKHTTIACSEPPEDGLCRIHGMDPDIKP